GTLTWTVSGSGIVEPRLEGTIYLDDTETCARMRMTYTGQLGNELAVKYGGTVCGGNDELKRVHLDLAPHSSSSIDHVPIPIAQSHATPPPGVWVQVGAVTEYLN